MASYKKCMVSKWNAPKKDRQNYVHPEQGKCLLITYARKLDIINTQAVARMQIRWIQKFTSVEQHDTGHEVKWPIASLLLSSNGCESTKNGLSTRDLIFPPQLERYVPIKKVSCGSKYVVIIYFNLKVLLFKVAHTQN